jgi:hypothetical protein
LNLAPEACPRLYSRARHSAAVMGRPNVTAKRGASFQAGKYRGTRDVHLTWYDVSLTAWCVCFLHRHVGSFSRVVSALLSSRLRRLSENNLVEASACEISATSTPCLGGANKKPLHSASTKYMGIRSRAVRAELFMPRDSSCSIDNPVRSEVSSRPGSMASITRMAEVVCVPNQRMFRRCVSSLGHRITLFGHIACIYMDADSPSQPGKGCGSG